MSLAVTEPPRTTSRAAAPARGLALIAALLDEQGDLTAVERFTRAHREASPRPQARRYEALLPAAPPGPGQQLAFEVDLVRCSGCKACVAACHALNGLDDGESWREVGLLVDGRIGPVAGPAVLQHVTSSCHHCLEPACLAACPVDAYEKDPVTGIVRHLDDQCIGCRYCTLACPYDAPKYHAGKGIVRKCDLCADRLRAGEAPACAQACPHEAIAIRVVDVAEVRARSEAGSFLTGAFEPSFTRPTTLYRSARPLDASARPADAHWDEPEHAHPPLVAMLVLTQLSVGGLAADLILRLDGGAAAPMLPTLAVLAGLAGLAASVLHLGRPQHAYRAILGVGHSWLSREVLAFGVFAKLALATLGLEWLGDGRLGLTESAAGALRTATVAAGLAGVACSILVYHAVRRPGWRANVAGVKFAGTMVVLGLAATLASLGLAGDRARSLVGPVAAALVVAAAAKLGFEAWTGRDEGTVRLLRGPLRRVALARWVLGWSGGVLLPALAVGPGGSGAAALALVAALGGELAERMLFFAAAGRRKMPGGLGS